MLAVAWRTPTFCSDLPKWASGAFPSGWPKRCSATTREPGLVKVHPSDANGVILVLTTG